MPKHFDHGEQPKLSLSAYGRIGEQGEQGGSVTPHEESNLALTGIPCSPCSLPVSAGQRACLVWDAVFRFVPHMSESSQIGSGVSRSSEPTLPRELLKSHRVTFVRFVDRTVSEGVAFS